MNLKEPFSGCSASVQIDTLPWIKAVNDIIRLVMTNPEDEFKKHLYEVLTKLKSLELHAAEGDPLEYRISTVVGGGQVTGREERSILRKLIQQGVIESHGNQWFDDNFENAPRYFLQLDKNKFDTLYSPLRSGGKQNDSQAYTSNTNTGDNPEVIFSLAGEQKELGQEIKDFLTAESINCWIYTEHEHVFPGRDQTLIIEELFKKKSSFCVALVSKEYVAKKWPILEGKYIKDRWMIDENYLIPINTDGTKLPGLPDLTGYVSTRGKSVKQISEVIISTIQERKGTAVTTKNVQAIKPSYPLPRLTKSFDHMHEKVLWTDYVINELKERVGNVEGMQIYSDSAMASSRIRIHLDGNIIYSLDIYKNSMLGEKSIGFFGTFGDIPLSSGNATNAWGNFVWSKETESVVLELVNASMLPTMGEKKQYTKEQLVDTVWQYLVEHLDENY